MNALKDFVIKHTGYFLTAATLSSVGGWRLVVMLKPDRLQAAATELGSIGQYKDSLYPNKAGTRIVYTEDVETGEGLFLSEIPGGKTKQLCVLNENDYGSQRFGMMGWSPDDSYFVYALPFSTNMDNLVICDGKTGQTITNIPAVSNLAGLAWLTPKSFAYLTLYYQFIKEIEQKDDGRWVETHDFGRIYRGRGSAQNLVATSPTTLAWHNGTNIWELDINGNAPTIIWQGTTNKIMELTFSPERGELLLNCADEKGRYLVRFNPVQRWSGDGGRMGDVLHPAQNVSLVNSPAYAYQANDHGTNAFFMKLDGQEKLARLSWPGAVRTFTLSGENLYIAGSVGRDPAGIYQYDVKNELLHPVVSSLKQPLRYARCVEPMDGVFTNESGLPASYHVWRPANLSPNKKYPVILCQTPYIWTPFPQIAANAGYMYAWVDRPGWFDGIGRWRDDVRGLYNIIAKDPNVDTDRVFLYGASAETIQIGRFLNELPDSVRGIIYFSPAAAPSLSDTRLSSMLLVVGQDEGDKVVQRWKEYQNQAANQGIGVSLDFESGAKHISRSVSTERDRARQLAKFLQEN